MDILDSNQTAYFSITGASTLEFGADKHQNTKKIPEYVKNLYNCEFHFLSMKLGFNLKIKRCITKSK